MAYFQSQSEYDEIKRIQIGLLNAFELKIMNLSPDDLLSKEDIFYLRNISNMIFLESSSESCVIDIIKEQLVRLFHKKWSTVEDVEPYLLNQSRLGGFATSRYFELTGDISHCVSHPFGGYGAIVKRATPKGLIISNDYHWFAATIDCEEAFDGANVLNGFNFSSIYKGFNNATYVDGCVGAIVLGGWNNANISGDLSSRTRFLPQELKFAFQRSSESIETVGASSRFSRILKLFRE